jgi:hypothetical protein
MSVACSGTVVNNLAGTGLTFTDTGTGYGTLVSRTLVIKDPLGNVLATINMGAALTYLYVITVDQYVSFNLTVIDNTGTYTCQVNYLAQGFYTVSYLALIAQSGCGCNGNLCNVDIAERFLAAANRFAVAGLGVAANNNIIAANIYINMQS